jgi:feruloyl esterase
VTALAGKGIVHSYYGHALSKSYFMGCSAGGVQAMWEAQNFPSDFDGIIAGGPALRLSDIWMSWLWNNRALTGTDGAPIFGHRDLEVLHQAIVAKCDLNDGIKDGLIGDPRQCQLDPAELRCTTSKTSECLTPQQINAAKKVYEGPVTSSGEQIATPIALKGSELTWLDMYGGSESQPNPAYMYFRDWFRYSVFPIDFGPPWKPADFDFDRDSQRLGAMEALEPHNADLRRFKAAGRKLLVYTGWSDSIEGVLNTTAYYETAERIVGGRSATQDFFRLFVIPGMNHCVGGEGAFDVDYLNYLEGWVEKGHAPDVMMGAHPKGDDYAKRGWLPPGSSAVSFTRPIYPYPLTTRYKGSGAPDKAESFKPVSK